MNASLRSHQPYTLFTFRNTFELPEHLTSGGYNQYIKYFNMNQDDRPASTLVQDTLTQDVWFSSLSSLARKLAASLRDVLQFPRVLRLACLCGYMEDYISIIAKTPLVSVAYKVVIDDECDSSILELKLRIIQDFLVSTDMVSMY